MIQAVKAAIMREELRPGHRETEVGLAKMLQVGQATVREALIELELKGFIQKRYRNKYVIVLSESDINGMYAVRITFERLDADWLVLREERNLDELEKARAAMVETSRGGDLERFKEADYAFHLLLWAQSRNSYLQGILEHLVPQLFAFAIANIHQRHPSRDEVERLANFHRNILRGIQSR